MKRMVRNEHNKTTRIVTDKEIENCLSLIRVLEQKLYSLERHMARMYRNKEKPLKTNRRIKAKEYCD